MKLNEILEPVSNDLVKVKAELDKIKVELLDSPSKVVFEHYFKIPGKLLRPSLLLLSAATANISEYDAARPKLVKAASAIELIHNASLIHDDIVDHELLRRGQKTINNVFGSKIAVVAGNALFARAVSILLKELSKEPAMHIVRMIRKMSSVEISQYNKGNVPESRKEYTELIEGKTALLMSSSCLLGASIVTTEKEIISALAGFGMNFGMAYQIADDIIDQDPLAAGNITAEDAKEFSGLAVSSLQRFGESIHKGALIEMLEYILSLAHFDAETKAKSGGN